ncbi:MAG: hypothetical protein FWC91_00500 [Defluviitaleaceae bacterium]|nr:hypothetical protein [Defluviitaleaceae bacterium]
MASKTRRPGQSSGASNDWRDPGADSPDGGVPVIPLLIGFVLIVALVAILVFNVFNIRDGILLPPFQGIPLVGNIATGGDAYITVDGDVVIAADSTIAEVMAEVEALRAQLNTATALNTQYEETIRAMSIYRDFITTYRTDRFRLDQAIASGDPVEFSLWYENMEPGNAAYLYQQIQIVQRVDREFRRFANTYSQMNPEDVAPVFTVLLNNNPDLLIRILQTFNNAQQAGIFAEMQYVDVARITMLLEPDADVTGILPNVVQLDNLNLPTTNITPEETQAEAS